MIVLPLTPADFLERFPEFTNTPTELVRVKLLEAWQRTPPWVWGLEVARDAQGYLAAHLLVLSPYGRLRRPRARLERRIAIESEPDVARRPS